MMATVIRDTPPAKKLTARNCSEPAKIRMLLAPVQSQLRPFACISTP